jgi:hypothetical protein
LPEAEITEGFRLLGLDDAGSERRKASFALKEIAASF